MARPTAAAGRPVIFPDDHVLVFVVRKDGEPAILLNGCRNDQAAALLRMMADHLDQGKQPSTPGGPPDNLHGG